PTADRRPPTADEIVALSQVIFRYPDGTTLAYEGCDLTVRPGERVLLLGPNGSGKSTLLYLLAGLYSPVGGSIRVCGLDPARHFDEVRSRIGVLLQNPGEQIVAPTVRDDIAFGPRNFGIPEAEIQQRLEVLADELHICHVLDKVPHHLSGGEQLKVALAGALILRPQLLLLDEPFEGLDTTSKTELTELLNDLRDRYGVAVVVSTHEVNLVPHFVDTIYLLAPGGRIVRRGTPTEVLGDPDLLARHHLEPPVLAELFVELQRAGVALGMALTVPEAADRLLRALAVKTSDE
ncbi:MAG: ABC transporter ATP-binding protein, partial [Chloroflexi bacterium]|nr:ABC transporter ATP-binding protein [Chloroflexota bacterium]